MRLTAVFNQMSMYNGDNTYKGKSLFRAGLMDSGSIIPADPVNRVKGQKLYDAVVKAAQCSGSSDTLNCLRSVDYETYLKAATSVREIFDYFIRGSSYLPRPDGVVLTESAKILAQNGQYAKVPFIVGDQEDEGTLFSLVQSNITTTAQLVDYLKTLFSTMQPLSRVSNSQSNTC